MRKEFPELAAKLSGERFIVRKNECGAIDLGNDIRHCKGLSRTGDAEKRLFLVALAKSVRQLSYRLRLVARRLIGRNKLKFVAQ